MQKVVVIGQGYSGRLGIARAVAEMGCEVTIIATVPRNKKNGKLNTKKPIDAYSKYVSHVYFCEGHNTKMLLDILLTKCADAQNKSILIPDNDFSAGELDKHRNQLDKFFYIPHIHNTAGEIETWMDKARQKEIALSEGLNVVNSTIVTAAKKIDNLPAGIHYPCFVKPQVSWTGRKWGMRRCNDETELVDCLHFAYSNWGNIPMLVEDYKVIDREFATLGFSDGSEVIIPGLLELLHIGHNRSFGVALQGKAFPVFGFEELVEKFKTLIKKIGFVGIFDIDFFESEGKIYFCELNLRYGGSGYVFTKLGVNLPVMMIKTFLGESIDGMQKEINREVKYFNERIAIDDWYGGYLSTSDYIKLKSESEIRFVDSDEDPIPQKMLDKEFRIKKIKKTVKRWIGKE